MNASDGPFPGPLPFPFDDRDKYPFRGRAREIADMADLVLSYRTVVLHAQSGAGKTSLLNAGLLPRLLGEDVQVLGARLAATEHEPRRKNVFLRDGFASLQVAQDGAMARWRSPPARFVTLVRRTGTTLLVLDQFEEVFSANPWEWRQRRTFFKILTWALSRYPSLHLLLALRDDHLADLESFAHLFPNQLRVRYRLDKLGADAARKALVEPLVVRGWAEREVEALTKDVVKDLLATKVPDGQPVEGEFVEPLHLQIQADQIWRSKAEPNAPTKPRPIEPIDRALRRFYDQAVDHACGLNPWRRWRLRRWVDRKLITPAGTRGMAFVDGEKTKGMPSGALQILAGEGVVRMERRSNATWCELSHDRFIEPVRASNYAWRTAVNLAVGAILFLLVVGFGAFGIATVKRLRAGNAELQVSDATKTEALVKAARDNRKLTKQKEQAEAGAAVTQLVAAAAPALSTPTALLDTDAPSRGDRERARNLWQQGYRAFNQGKEEAARGFYTRAAEADPSYAPAFNSLGRLAIDDSDYAGAETQLKTAIAADPKYAPAYQNLALLYTLTNRYADARGYLQQALNMDARFPQAKRLLNKLAQEDPPNP